MAWFGKKRHQFEKVFATIDTHTVDESWIDVLESTWVVGGQMSASVVQVLPEIRDVQISHANQVMLMIESQGFALEVTERIAFSKGGPAFRDGLLAFLDTALMALTVDVLLEGGTAPTAEQAEQHPRELLASVIADLGDLSDSYKNVQGLLSEENKFSQEGSVLGIFMMRIGKEFSVQNNPL